MANLGLLNKNPGNIKDPSTGKFRVFSSPEEGQRALIDDIKYKQSGKSKHIKPGASLSQLASVWAPASDNNVPENWAKNVARTLGVSTAEAFDKIPAEKLAEGIKVAEGTSTMTKNSSYSLAKRIRAKYPTQYSNLSDSELERKVIAKYPQYSHLGSGPQSLNAALKESGYSTPSSTSTSPVAKKDFLDKAGDVSKKILNVTGGNKVADWLGTVGGQIGTKVGDIAHGTNASKYYDTSNLTPGNALATGADAARLAGTLLTLKGIGGLFKKAGLDVPLTAGQKAMSPVGEAAINRYIPSDVGNKSLSELMQPDNYDVGTKYNALIKAYRTASPADKIPLLRDITAIYPDVLKASGAPLSLAEKSPIMAKVGGLLGKGLRGALKLGTGIATIGLGTRLGTQGLLSQVLKGKDLTNTSRPFNQ